nr:DapH/DapD/GlmU-related protein [uncultured Marinifilum sp.]
MIINNLFEFIRKNGIGGALYLVYCFVRSKMKFSNARLIRFPFRIRGKKYITVGDGFTTGYNCRLDAFPIDPTAVTCLSIGRNFQMNDNVHIAAVSSVEIGNNVLIASKVFITDHDHGFYGENEIHDHPDTIPKDRKLSFAPIRIEDNVWIGQNVCILKGVTVGKGSIIGANSVVTTSIPDYSIAVGSPARIVKTYNTLTGKWEKV